MPVNTSMGCEQHGLYLFCCHISTQKQQKQSQQLKLPPQLLHLLFHTAQIIINNVNFGLHVDFVNMLIILIGQRQCYVPNLVVCAI
uniref:Uncharacterized protein n=1 Tax=Meloidogyne enterolobii TaxID=390850 RepID=A0A6V7UMQ2_MELEN|nr:unnamed protein product [Meloidogyne enterolobii]